MSQSHIKPPYLPFPIVRLSPKKKKSDCGSLAIPKEILFELCKTLSDSDILALSQTCRTMYEELSDDGFWIALGKEREKLEFEDFDPEKFPSVKKWHVAQLKLSVHIEEEHQLTKEQMKYAAAVLLTGPSQVGKTQLMNALLGKPFSGTYAAFQGITHHSGCWRQASRLASIQIWDAPGNPTFRNANNVFYRAAQVVVLVYSVLDSNTFQAVDSCYQDVTTYCKPGTTKILISTHIDAPQEEHKVKQEEASLWAKNHQIPHIGVSSKTGQGLRFLMKLIMDQLEEREEKMFFFDRSYFL